MDETIRTAAISPLRQRPIDGMNMRRFSLATQQSCIRDVGALLRSWGARDDATQGPWPCFM
jgi:integrase/recombinase XerD